MSNQTVSNFDDKTNSTETDRLQSTGIGTYHKNFRLYEFVNNSNKLTFFFHGYR